MDILAHMWISLLNEPLFQDHGVTALVRMGEDAVPRLMTYLSGQAELERELVSDLERYFQEKETFEKEYRKIVTSETVPQWTGSTENADALALCESKLEANDLVFVKRWGGSPDAVAGFSSTKECPSRTGVEAALLALESIGSKRVMPFLQELADQFENVQRMSFSNGYSSVFALVPKLLRRILGSN